MKRAANRWAIVSACLGAAWAVAAPARAQGSAGVVVGRVVDSEGGLLPGARVQLVGTALQTTTNRIGEYRLTSVPAGPQKVEVSVIGFETSTVEVVVQADEVVVRDAELKLVGFAEEVEVSAPLLEGQMKALNQQRMAPNLVNVVAADQIGSFPDPNAAEATQRIPGISIQRDQGEGRYVLIRGTEARLNAMTINGERIPSPEAQIRNVSLDVIPTDLLQAIEVSKALTPDMDADAIGGSVNLVTREAPEKQLIQVMGAGGYNQLRDDFGTAKAGLSWGRRFAANRAGVLLSGSYYRENRGSDNFEPSYDDGELEELQIRDYSLTRKRWGTNAAFDYRLAPGSTLFLNGIYNRYSDFEYRRATVYAVADEEAGRELSDRLEEQAIASVSGGGRHLLSGSGFELDYKLTWAYAREEDLSDLGTNFELGDVAYSPNVSPGSIDPDDIQANPLNEDIGGYELDEQELSSDYARDRDVVGSVNLRIPLATRSDFAGFLKVGAKHRRKHKVNRTDVTAFSPEDDLALSDFLDRGFDSGDFLGGRYAPGPHVDPEQARSFTTRFPFESEFDHESDAEDFEARENVTAAYAMAQLTFGQLFVLPGVRWERTTLDYTGYRVTFDEDGDYAGTDPVTGTDDYSQVLPMVHLRWSPVRNVNLRAALTRSLARPNYYDLVPYQLINDEDREIVRGNPGLGPTTSWNVDLSAERYFDSIGILSAGVFRKSLRDYIYLFRVEEERDGSTFDVIQPLNGEEATVTGLELAVQRQLTFLPSPLDGVGVYANYTFTDSEAVFPGREGVAASLPGQSRHVGNAALSYEKFGFSGRVAVNFHGKYIDQVGEDPAEDVYYDDHVQLDLSLSQRVTGKVRLFADLVNLTNEPLRYYVGVPDRPVQEEYYRWWASFGVKVNF